MSDSPSLIPDFLKMNKNVKNASLMRGKHSNAAPKTSNRKKKIKHLSLDEVRRLNNEHIFPEAIGGRQSYSFKIDLE